MFSAFLDRNVIVVGLLLLVAAAGALLGVIGCARERSASALGAAALLLALACAGIGVAQRQALVNASAFAASVPGLSRADRERIVAYKLADAGYALDVSLLSALAPLAAGALSILLAFRRSNARLRRAYLDSTSDLKA